MSRPALFALHDAGFQVGSTKSGDVELRFPLLPAWESFVTHGVPAKSDFGQVVFPAPGWRLLLDCIDEAILDVRDPFIGDLFTAVRRRYARAHPDLQKRILARTRYLVREMEHEG